MSRIAFVSTMDGAPWGGSEELWCGAAKRLAGMGHYVAANVPWWPQVPARLAELRRAGCRVERRRRTEDGWPRISAALRRRLLGDDGHRWLDSIRPDVVIISQGWNQDGIDWLEACARRAVRFAPLVQSAHEAWWPADEQAARLAAAYEAAVTAFFVSEANVALTRAQLATPLGNARLVRNPFNVSYDAAPPWPEPPEPLRLACVGRLDPKAKGQDVLFDVLRRRKWRERRVELTLFGDGPCRESLKRLARIHDLERVAFGGVRSDVESIWADHHALVLPSRYEGLPLAVVEAMLCGRPCIVSGVAGNAELLDDGATGFVAAAPTTAALDAAMERAWQARGSLPEMGRAAAASVRRQVPRDPVARFVEEVLRLLSGGPAGDSPDRHRSVGAARVSA